MSKNEYCNTCLLIIYTVVGVVVVRGEALELDDGRRQYLAVVVVHVLAVAVAKNSVAVLHEDVVSVEEGHALQVQPLGPDHGVGARSIVLLLLGRVRHEVAVLRVRR